MIFIYSVNTDKKHNIFNLLGRRFSATAKQGVRPPEKSSCRPSADPNVRRPRPVPGQNAAPHRRPMRLPFEKRRRGDWATWIYRHRVGLMVTVVIYLVAGILFMSYKIMLTPAESYVGLVELVNPEEQQPEEIPPEQEQQKQIEQMEEMRYEQLRNRVSNDNARLDAGLKDDKGSKAREIYAEAERVQRQLAAGREAYEKSLEDLSMTETPRQSRESAKGDSEKRESRYEKGGVTVRYDLAGRTDVYLLIPAYQCQGGGQVVVDITVNRNGKVIAASVQKTTSIGDECIQEKAVQAAYASSFNASETAPEKQKGTITYTFKAQ